MAVKLMEIGAAAQRAANGFLVRPEDWNEPDYAAELDKAIAAGGEAKPK